MFFKIGILKNSENFREKQVKYAKFLRTPFFAEYVRWLLPRMSSVRKLLQQVVIHFAVFC